ncbi:MAG: 2OG-Fe(II) oxygenase [Elsteraceae bacterium]
MHAVATLPQEERRSPPFARLALEAFEATPLGADPFDHLLLPDFLGPADCAAARAAFPLSDFGGLAPAPEEASDDGLGRLMRALRRPEVTDAFARKFGVALDPEALMIHLRSRAQEKDGRIHTDSRDKLVTALLYLNDGWPHAGGRLRLLRNGEDLEDYVAEAPPLDGFLIAFRRTDHSWHGHHPYVGVRRCVMFNWMVSKAVARRELKRHALSAGMKRMLFSPFAGPR